MAGPSLGPPARGPLVIVGGHLLVYLAATTLLPWPGSLGGRLALAAFWLFPPAILAVHAAAGRARGPLGMEKAFWAFLAASCVLRVLGVVLFTWGEIGGRSPLVRLLSLMANHAAFGLLTAALLLRGAKPRGEWEVGDGLLLATTAAFLPAYAALLFPMASGPALLIRALEDVVPAALALRLALGEARPETSADRRLALALCAAALLAIPARGSYYEGSRQPLGPIDVAWILPAWGVFAAARARAGESWLTADAGERPPERNLGAIAATVAVPALVDLAARAFRLPGDAETRSLLVLATAAILALLSGLRLRGSIPERVPPRVEEGKAESAPELVRLASGTAHELNNPFMAVALAAELAVARGGAETPLRALQLSVQEAAAAVRRFQLVAASRSPGSDSLR